MLTTSVTVPSAANLDFIASEYGVAVSRIAICGTLTKRGVPCTCVLIGPYFCYTPAISSEAADSGPVARASASRHTKMLPICDADGLALTLSEAQCQIVFESKTRLKNVHRKAFQASSLDELLCWKASMVRAGFLWSVAPAVQRLRDQTSLGPVSTAEAALSGIMESLVRSLVSLTLLQLCGDLSSMGKPLIGGWVKGLSWHDTQTLRCGDRRYEIGRTDVVSRAAFNSSVTVVLAQLERIVAEQVNTIIEKVSNPYSNRTNRHLEEILNVGEVKDEDDSTALAHKATVDAAWTGWVGDAMACSRQFSESALRRGADVVAQYWPCAPDQMPLRVAVRSWVSMFPTAPYACLLRITEANLVSRVGGRPRRSGKAALSGLRGVHNMGNSCYLNAVLQCLTHTPAFSRFFLLNAQHLYVTSSITRDNPLASAIARFVGDLWKYISEQDTANAAMVLHAEDIFDALNADCKAAGIPVFPPQTQQDAHEALVQLLDRLGEELGGRADQPRASAAARTRRSTTVGSASFTADATAGTATELPCYTSATLSQGELVQRWRRAYVAHNPHFLAKCFAGQTVQTLCCPECQAMSYCCDSFMYLFTSFPDTSASLRTKTAAEAAAPVQAGASTEAGTKAPAAAAPASAPTVKAVTIEACLTALFSDESIDMGGGKCEQCGKTMSQPATRNIGLHNLPPCLILSVNRALTDNVGYVTGKCQTPLTVRRRLTLGPWMTPTTESSCPVIMSSGSVESLAAFDVDPRVRGEYELYGVVLHHGEYLNQGHYTAACIVAETWHHFDDAKVTAIADFDQWIAARGKEIYILFYRSLAPEF